MVKGFGLLRTANYAHMTEAMGYQIASNIKDPSVREWVIPNFSTTTATDQVVGAAILMASMQKFFDYKFEIECGIPQVTLLGEISDWKNIQERAKRLVEFDVDGHMKVWSDRLAPILAEFTKSAEGNPSTEFWQTICHYKDGGSGPTYLCGWITTFCMYDDSQRWIGDFKSRYRCPTLTDYHYIDTQDIPAGMVSVPVLVEDAQGKYKTTLFAGHDAYTIIDGTGVQPTLSWRLILGQLGDDEVELTCKEEIDDSE